MKIKEFNFSLASKYRREIMGFACVYIMLSHYTFHWQSDFISQTLKTICNYGNVGVELFLLASGIGLYYSYKKCPTKRVFFAHRYVRILIPYILLSVPYWAWRDFGVGKGNFWMDTFQLSFPMSGTITFWYIAATSVYYLVFPLIFYIQNNQNALKLKTTRATKTLLMCFVALALMFLLIKFTPLFYKHIEIGLTRILIFIIGCHLGKSVQEKKPIPQHYLLVSMAFCVGFIMFWENITFEGFWYRMFYVPFGIALLIVLMWFFDLEHTKFLRSIFGFIGDRSLELYITHIAIRNIYEYYSPNSFWSIKNPQGYALVLVMAFVVSIAVHPLIKKINSLILKT